MLSVIQDRKRVRVDDLADWFATTPQTIRKDLQRLVDLHHVVRFHGGAAVLGGVEYTSFAARRDVMRAEKAAIGARVAQLIPNACTIFVNAGTTTELVVRELQNHTGLRLITDNVDMASSARLFPGVEVVIPGGRVRGSDGSILGAEAVDFIRQFRFDFAVIGAAAMAADGALLDFDIEEAQVCRAIIASARHVILALDSGKFSRSAPVRFGDLSQIQTLVTDAAAPDWIADLCARHEVEVDRVDTRQRAAINP